MKNLLHVLIIILIVVSSGWSQAEFFHKRDNTYIKEVPSPEQFVGFKPGDSHLNHLQIELYCKLLAEKSPRAQLLRIGDSYEGRSLLLLIISSESNIENIEDIRLKNLQLLKNGYEGTPATDIIRKNPVFVWLAAAVHGDEASSPDAVMELAYQLTASNDESVKNILNNAVVLIDPLQNPDGRQRTVEYYQHLGSIAGNPDPNAAEHQLPWPYGRGNHYLFDMNRDWLLLTQRESVARVIAYQNWFPQVFVDLHEMGHNSGYYFSPPADPVNENIPQITRDWWPVFGKGNSAAFDRNGWRYWSHEVFDQYYPGYGESWPTFYGAIGMTYEQASSEGKGIKRKDDIVLKFRQTVWQHFTASLSTIQTAVANRERLVAYFYDFYRSAAVKYKKDAVKSVIINSAKYPSEVNELAAKLKLMGVKVSRAEEKFSASGYSLLQPEKQKKHFAKGSIIISLDQPAGYLVRAMLDYRQQLPDDFKNSERLYMDQKQPGKIYDVTSWSLLLGYGLDFYLSESAINAQSTEFSGDPENYTNGKAAYAYIFPYQGKNTIQGLVACLNNDIYLRVAREEFEIGGQKYARGTVIIPVAENDGNLFEQVQQIAARFRIPVTPAESGWTDSGISLGSTRAQHIKKPRIAVLSGQPTSAYSFGYVWWLLEQVYSLEFTAIKTITLKNVKLSEYDVIVIPSAWGDFDQFLDKKTMDKIKTWIQEGGSLVTLGGKANFFTQDSAGISKVKSGLKQDDDKKKEKITEIEGAYLRAQTLGYHYLGIGLESEIPVFISGSTFFQPQDEYFSVLKLAPEKSLTLSGLVWPEAAAQWAEKAVVVNENLGRGQLILFAQDPNFRGYQELTQKMFMNALLFSANMRERMR